MPEAFGPHEKISEKWKKELTWPGNRAVAARCLRMVLAQAARGDQ